MNSYGLAVGESFELRFPYADRMVNDVKKVLNATFNQQKKCWEIPLEYMSLQSLKTFLAKYPEITFSREVLEKVREVDHRGELLYELSSAEESLYEVPEIQEISSYQCVGVEYMDIIERGFIGDAPGVGKTLQSLAFLEHLDTFPALIVVPSFVKLNWRDEIEYWLPERSLQVINSKQQEVHPADITLVNYDLLSDGWINRHVKIVKLSPVMEELDGCFNSLVMDEFHLLKTSGAQRSRAMRLISEPMRYRIGLTGSAILNRPDELVYPLEILGCMKYFGGEKAFTRRYCPREKDQTSSRNNRELYERLRRNCMVRRTKDQVLKNLPPKRYSTLPVEITNREEYTYAERDLIRWVADKARENPEFLTRIAHLDPDEQETATFLEGLSASLKAEAAETLVKVNALKRLTAEGKISAALEWIDTFLESGEQLVVFAHHTNIVERVADRFKVPSITGKVPDSKRHEYVKQFQQGDIQVLPLNIQTGGTGINLFSASDVLMVEYPWSPAIYDQATDRLHRRGQEDSVMVWNLVGSHTMDATMIHLLEQKRRVIDQVMDDRDSASVFEGFLNTLT